MLLLVYSAANIDFYVPKGRMACLSCLTYVINGTSNLAAPLDIGSRPFFDAFIVQEGCLDNYFACGPIGLRSRMELPFIVKRSICITVVVAGNNNKYYYCYHYENLSMDSLLSLATASLGSCANSMGKCWWVKRQKVGTVWAGMLV